MSSFPNVQWIVKNWVWECKSVCMLTIHLCFGLCTNSWRCARQLHASNIYISIHIKCCHPYTQYLKKFPLWSLCISTFKMWKCQTFVRKSDCKVIVSFDIPISNLDSTYEFLREWFFHLDFTFIHIHSFHTLIVIWHWICFSTKLFSASLHKMSEHLVRTW